MQWRMEAYLINQKGVEDIDHYLDDFFIVTAKNYVVCQQALSVALGTCEEVGCPVAGEKTEGPATVITLLGVKLDSIQFQLRLPQDKLKKLREMVAKWRSRKLCSKRELQVLAGHLCHACKVVRPGRRFLRGIFGLLSQFRRRDHMIRLNAAFRADLEWWHAFAGGWNGVSMMLEDILRSPGVEVWSDASGSWGCGAIWETEWLQLAWSDCGWFLEAPIAAKELLPIVLAAAVWGPRWVGHTVMFHCDNQAAVAAVRGGYCKDPDMARMLRCLFFLEAHYVVAVHVPGVNNEAADSVSRNNLSMFFSLIPQAYHQPSPASRAVVDLLTHKHPWTDVDWSCWREHLLRNQ